MGGRRASRTPDPRNADALYVLQYAVRVGGDADRSERLLETAISLNENHAPAYAGLGALRILTGLPEQAHAFLDRALAIHPAQSLACEIHGTNIGKHSVSGGG